MSAAPSPVARRRILIWGGLLLLLAVSTALLLMAVSSRKERPEETPQPGPSARRPIVVRVVDVQGAPVPGVHVFVAQDAGEGEQDRGTWSDEDATLTLPFTGKPRSLWVQAQGFRSQAVEDVVGDRTVVLEPGYVARFVVTGDPEVPESPVHLYVRLNPLPAEGATLSPQQANTILELMAPLLPAKEGLPEMPPSGFGLLLAQERAAGGVRLPLAGRYRVQWGLVDEKAGTWYALLDGTEHVVEVAEDASSSRFEIPVTSEAVALTLQGLRDQIARMQATAADDDADAAAD